MNHEFQIIKPMAIENESFKIIQEELGAMGVTIEEEKKAIVKRVIHTTADFSYVENLYFSPDVVNKAIMALKEGPIIVTDTNMAKAGINKVGLEKCGGEVRCFMASEEVAKAAKERQVTRAIVSMEKAATMVTDKPLIVVVGNAPTALIALHDLMAKGAIKPALIIGAPVGFVNVVESKELIVNSDVPAIVVRGRKGGSNVAAAIINALLYMANPREA